MGGTKKGASLLPTEFSKNARHYIRDMEQRSGIKFSKEQKENLMNSLRNKKFEKLDPITSSKHKAPFKNPSTKVKLISEWEKNTGNKWSTSTKINKKTGQLEELPDQFHHIIPQEFGGPHTWWNGHPLRGGTQHQGGVHGKGAPLNQIIKDIKK